MSDHEDPSLEPSFDDPAHDELRALLADARVTEPVPEAVAARLDATLQSLQAERAGTSDPARETRLAPVVPLRRRAARVLVAAAAVVVVGAGGFGIARLANGNGGTASSMSSADKAAGEGSGGTAVVPGAPGQSDFVNAPNASAAKALPHLTTAHFSRDAARVMRATYLQSLDTGSLDTRAPNPTDGTDTPGQVAGSTPLPGYAPNEAPPVTTSQELSDSLTRSAFASCAGPAAPGAVVDPATLDGALVALVFRPPAEATQQVEAWSCDGTTLLASARIGH